MVQTLFSRLPDFCHAKAELCIYGPFNYDGQFTSDSNAMFDASLKAQNPLMGIRDIEAVVQLALSAGFTLQYDHAMPANNRLLHFSRVS